MRAGRGYRSLPLFNWSPEVIRPHKPRMRKKPASKYSEIPLSTAMPLSIASSSATSPRPISRTNRLRSGPAAAVARRRASSQPVQASAARPGRELDSANRGEVRRETGRQVTDGQEGP